MQRNKNIWPFTGKKELPEILLKEEQILNLLEKDFKSTLKYAQKYKRNHGQKKS